MSRETTNRAAARQTPEELELAAQAKEAEAAELRAMARDMRQRRAGRPYLGPARLETQPGDMETRAARRAVNDEGKG